MAGCNCNHCGFNPCRCCGSFTVLTGAEYGHTLIQSLTGCVDSIRDIKTCLGARPYQVSLLWTRWSGGERGVGVEELVRRELLLPTPKIADLTSLRLDLQPIGIDEVGVLRVSEISPRFNEDFLVGRDDVGHPIPVDVNFFWEIFFPRPPVGAPGVRRRFTPKSAPTYNPTQFQWSIDLLKASEDRVRSGMLAQ